MPPNPRCVVAQGWRSIGSRRNFSSSPGSKGEIESIFKSNFYPSFTTFRFSTWALYGYLSYTSFEMYQLLKIFREGEELYRINLEDIRRSMGED